MATYNITYICGHEGTVKLNGPKRTREWIVSNKEKELCPDCYKKHLEEERAAERAAAQEAAKEQELPDLVGTEKQINWALVLRETYLNRLGKLLQTYSLKADIDSVIIQNAIEDIQNETSAYWWIDNRDSADWQIEEILTRRYSELLKLRETTGCISHEEIIRESTIRPESPVSELPAEIKIEKDVIYIKYPVRNDIFREIVKGKGFRWQGDFWARRISKFAGTMQDRAGEIGNLLLKSGFIIQAFDEEAREKAISGNYEREQKRWIAARSEGKYKGYFAISWEYGNQKIYEASRSIAGSRWDNPDVVIPASQYEAVLDLADEFEFKLSEGAQKLSEEAIKTKESSIVVKPGDALEPVKEIKSIPGEIDDELRDDN
jgi:hypothetical protein